MQEPAIAIDRSAAGLREFLFTQIEALRDGKINEKRASTYANMAAVIVKSAELQLKFERQKLESKVPQHMGEMRLVPPLTEKRDGAD